MLQHNPIQILTNWAKLTNGRTMGAVSKVTIDPDGEHIWDFICCNTTEPERFGDECLDSGSLCLTWQSMAKYGNISVSFYIDVPNPSLINLYLTGYS